MRRDNNAELLPLVDAEGNSIGCATRGECHNGSMLLHPVVHLHLLNKAGDIYLQQRPQWKEIQPGKWDTAVGGHVDYGETIDDALLREVREEVRITDFTPTFLVRYEFVSECERELVYVYKAVYEGEVRPSDELDGGRFWSVPEIDDAIGKGVLTPNFEQEYQMINNLIIQ